MKKIIIASGPVIVKNNKVLLDKQGKDNFWKFCGGRIKKGETLQETAIRRSKEELGIKIKIIDDKPFLMHVTKKDKKNLTDIIMVHWLSRAKIKIKMGKDVKKYEWINIDNLPNNLGPNIIPALKHFKFLK